jgi:hypothetical protein
MNSSMRKRAAAAGATVILAAAGVGVASAMSGSGTSAQNASFRGGPPGAAGSAGSTGAPNGFRGGPPGGAQEQLTGETAKKVKAAALAKVAGGTVLRTEKDFGGGGYHAHVRKANGTVVTVHMTTGFTVTRVEAMGFRGPDGDGDHRGDGDGPPSGGGTPPSGSSAPSAPSSTNDGSPT